MVKATLVLVMVLSALVACARRGVSDSGSPPPPESLREPVERSQAFRTVSDLLRSLPRDLFVDVWDGEGDYLGTIVYGTDGRRRDTFASSGARLEMNSVEELPGELKLDYTMVWGQTETGPTSGKRVRVRASVSIELMMQALGGSTENAVVQVVGITSAEE